MKKWLFLFALLLPIPVMAADSPSYEVEVYNAQTFEKEGNLTFLEPREHVSFALADISGEGMSDLIIGADMGEDPLVHVYTASGELLYEWMAYTPGYRGGVEVAAVEQAPGDVYLITGTRFGGGPHVKVTYPNGDIVSQFMAFDPETRSGVRVAGGELLSSMTGPEVVVATGEGEHTLVRVYSLYGALISEWYPFGESATGGAHIEVTPAGTVLVSRAFGNGPMVREFSPEGALVNEFLAYYDGFPGGVITQAVPTPYGGYDIFTAPGFSGGPHMRNFSAQGNLLSPGFNAFNGTFMGGLVFDEGDIDGDGQIELVVHKSTIVEGSAKTIKSIIVDLSDQTLTTYYRGNVVEEYLISSGTAKFPTPTGEFSIWRKREKTRMTWVYGPNNPDNYDLEDVPHALSYDGPYNIHGAYWHNNFGTPMSHGCVNMSLPDAEEVYQFADLGTSVIVQQ